MNIPPLFYGTAAGSVWGPMMMPGLVLWLRSDLGVIQGATFTWADQSGQGNNVSQSTGSQQPTLNVNDALYNGHPSLSFVSASSQSLVNGSFVQTQPCTLFVAGHSTEANFSNADEFVYGGSLGLWTNFSTGGLVAYAGATLTSTTTVTSPSVMGVTVNGSSSSLYVNSSSAVVANSNIGPNHFTTLAIGGENTLAHFLDGKIAEVIVYSFALGPAQISQVGRYLASRYGIYGTW